MTGLDQLRAAYVPRLRTQLDELAAQLDAADVLEATRNAHKIAGAAGSYGLAEVSVIARRVELALEAGESPAAQRVDVQAMRDAIPEVQRVDDAAVILVLGDEALAGDGVLVVSDPVEALQVAMDRRLRALILPYTSGALGGRALLRSLGGLEELSDVPLFLTEVDPARAEKVRQKAGAADVFGGVLDAALLAQLRERLS